MRSDLKGRAAAWFVSGQSLLAAALVPAGSRRANEMGGAALHRPQGRILVVRLDEIGDVTLFTPFLRELRRSQPGARITLIVNAAARNLVERCPYVDEVLAFDVRASRLLRPFVLPARAFLLARRDLQARGFDLALAPRWDTDTCYATLLVAWCGAPTRVGYSERVTERKARLNRGFDRLLTAACPDRDAAHETERSLHLLRWMGAEVRSDALEVWLDDDAEAFAETVLSRNGITAQDRLVALGPSGGHSALKRWPLERFAELGERLMAEGCRLVILGGPADVALGSALRGRLGPDVIEMVGKTTLREAAAIIRRCRVWFGNDTGLTHIAAAVGTPVVAVYGSSDPHRFGPRARRQVVLFEEMPCSPWRREPPLDRCKACLFGAPRCMDRIGVEAALDAVRGAMREPAAAPGRTAEVGTGIGVERGLP